MWVEASSTRVDGLSRNLSDCIRACACASAVRSKEMTGRQQRGYSLAFGAQPMCRASLRSFEYLTKVSSSPPVLSMHIRRSLVVSDGSSARWLATAAAAAAMPFPGVTGTLP